MNKKALKTLEFYKITEMLANYAGSDPGRALCKDLLPLSSLSDILRLQEECCAALSRIRMKGSISFGDTKNIGESLKRLQLGSGLNLRELNHIRALLDNVLRVIGYGKHEEEDYDALERYFWMLDPLSSLRAELSRCILSEEEIADHASAELLGIRKKQKQIDSRMHHELQSVLHAHKPYLMDAVITMRNESYCLPIRAEFKHKVAGIIHDQSSTGSTVFIEPMAIIRMNNELKELALLEKREIEKILELLSDQARPYAEEIAQNIENMSYLDFTYAKAKLAAAMKASKPLFNDEGHIHIKEGRHPLIDPSRVVPIEISLGKDFDLLIVTGPNTGGKTVSLKTVGLFTLMGQAGLHIPAFEGSRLAVFNEVFADIGDEQSIEQSLSTFSGHMRNIVEILEQADSSSLCLFDELGAGTDPTEGAALAISILSFLHRMRVRTVATTHYSELKLFALNTPGVENASCEFDVETLRPTYRILIGIPGKSNAFAISRKLGLPDFIIDEAKKHITEEAASFEDLLVKLEGDRLAIERERLHIEKDRREIEELKKHYQAQDAKITERREKLLREARIEAEKILFEAKETADTAIQNINKIASGAGLGSTLEKERDAIRNSLKKSREAIADRKAEKKGNLKPPKKLKLGDSVFVHSMNVKGVVSSLPNDKGKLFVQMGILRSQVDIKDIELIEEESADKPTKRFTGSSASFMKAATISPEINLIGMNVDEACSELNKYLDDAMLSHLNQIRIIHGRGTGALQKGIHQYLKKLPFIKSFHLAEFNEGGTAVTIVSFK